MKIPDTLRGKIPTIISLLETQCQEGEFLFMTNDPEIIKNDGEETRERYSIWAGVEDALPSDMRHVAILDRIKRGRRILKYQVHGTFSEYPK